jgi:NitT/TauT family transport system permease protein
MTFLPWRLFKALSTVLPIITFFAAWELIVRLRWVNAALLSPPTVAFAQLIQYFASGEILPHVASSLHRGVIGFMISLFLGVPLGLLIGSSRYASRALSPIVEFLRQLPPLAMLPVFLLFLGLGLKAQVGIVVWASIWPILLNTVTGARNVDIRLTKAALTLGATRRDLFLKVSLPAAVPTIMTGVRLGASYAFLVLVAAEMIGADSGIGYLILNNQYTFLIPQMYAAILLLALFGVLLNYGLLAFERGITPWSQKQ